MVLRILCKSKIHRATITEANVDYIGSVAIDEDLLERSNIIPGEKVGVWDVTNGERLETYALPAPRGSGSVIINGAAARRVLKGDIVIIVAFALTDEVIRPSMIAVDAHNKFVCDLVDNTAVQPVSDLDLLSTIDE